MRMGTHLTAAELVQACFDLMPRPCPVRRPCTTSMEHRERESGAAALNVNVASGETCSAARALTARAGLETPGPGMIFTADAAEPLLDFQWGEFVLSERRARELSGQSRRLDQRRAAGHDHRDDIHFISCHSRHGVPLADALVPLARPDRSTGLARHRPFRQRVHRVAPAARPARRLPAKVIRTGPRRKMHALTSRVWRGH